MLLDTNVLLWATLAPWSLSRTATAAITDASNTVLVSAASAWEIATKVRIGKLAGAEKLERDFALYMTDAGYIMLPIEVDVALRGGRLVGKHRDPFDRIIVAHALMLDIAVVSSDAKLDGFGVRRIW